MKVIHLFLILCSVTNESVANAFPLGVNLSPLSGENIGGDTFASVNWNPTSTNVFIDIFKHCSPLYIRKVIWISYNVLCFLKTLKSDY